MASDFIGTRVLVALRPPQDTPSDAPPIQVSGVVADILGQRLILHDGKAIQLLVLPY
jgi:hypothetical protein